MSLLNRASNTIVDRDPATKKRYYRSTIIPSMKRSNIDYELYTTVDGDNFPALAVKYYGNAKLWWIIAEYNDLVNGGYMIKPGTILKIPINLNEYKSLYDEENRKRII